MTGAIIPFQLPTATSPANRTGCSAVGTVPAAPRPTPAAGTTSHPADLAAPVVGKIETPEFMARHDALVTALHAYEAAQPGFRGAERFALTIASRGLGWSGHGDLLAWARVRVLAYHAVMAVAVRDMLAAISVNSCPVMVADESGFSAGFGVAP